MNTNVTSPVELPAPPPGSAGPSCACEPATPKHAEMAPGFFRRGGWLILALPLWVLLYRVLQPGANAVTSRLLGLDLKSHLGGAVAFFLYDAPKVLMLLSLVVLGVTFVQTFISPERTRDILAKRAGAWGNLLAALFGIITPFCSCSAVPLFIGFVRVGVPLGATLSFLISAPMVN